MASNFSYFNTSYLIVLLLTEQKEKLTEVEQQLKKAEAAQRRRMQVEKAARESEVCPFLKKKLSFFIRLPCDSLDVERELNIIGRGY